MKILVGWFAVLFSCATLGCSSDDGGGETAGKDGGQGGATVVDASGIGKTDIAIDCPGIDGIYYYVRTATGDCASLGVLIQDGGITVKDHGVITDSFPGCSEKVVYDGCTISRTLNCSMDVEVLITQTYVLGDPNTVTGTMTQKSPNLPTCVFKIYGSTDLALVRKHAGIEDAGDADGGSLVALATPGTPTPTNLNAATADCEANARAEEDACPREADIAEETAYCTEDWKRYDAEGCGDAWRAYTVCRTEKIGGLNCTTGINSACTVYQNAYLQCQSVFTGDKGCTVAGDPATLCAGGLGSYSYGCYSGQAPFQDCTEVQTGSAVRYYCCY